MKAKETKTKNPKNKSSISQFFNSPTPIIIGLIIFIICMMFYNRYLAKSTNFYAFSGFNTEFSIINGTIYTGRDINSFGDSKIIYNGENIFLKEFEMGYYIKDKEDYIKISVISAQEDLKDETVSLKELVETTDLSFVETKDSAKYMSKENLNNIDNLIFKITGVDQNEKDIEIEVEIDVTKLSK